MTLNMYYLENTGKEYVPPVFPKYVKRCDEYFLAEAHRLKPHRKNGWEGGPQMKRQPNNNGGFFSLLEVILAMAILAIISIPLLSYFTQSMKYNAMMADKQHATNLAQEVLEDLKTKKELAVVTTGAGFRVPYLEGKGYTLLRETPAAAPAPAFQAENVYYAAAGTSGSTYDVEVFCQYGCS